MPHTTTKLVAGVGVTYQHLMQLNLDTTNAQPYHHQNVHQTSSRHATRHMSQYGTHLQVLKLLVAGVYVIHQDLAHDNDLLPRLVHETV
jgi:hypothetical protein